MGRRSAAILAFTCIGVLAACGEAQTSGDPASASAASPATQPAGQTSATAPDAGQPSPGAGPSRKPGGGLVAEESGLEGNLSIQIRWKSEIVTGNPNEGVMTQTYNRVAQLLCPVTSSGESAYSYFATYDNPNGDPFAATGSYQPWFNEDCTGSLKIDDTYHLDDPTLAGPEPVVRTTGTRPLSTGDTPLTVETDLNRARTRYMFISPSAGGFQQQEAPGYPAKLVTASAAPIAVMDFTLEGPIGGGKREVKVQGGMLYVDWTFTRGRHQR